MVSARDKSNDPDGLPPSPMGAFVGICILALVIAYALATLGAF